MTSTHQMLSHVQQSDSCLVAQEDASSFNIDQNITLPVVSIQEQLQALQGKNHRVICIHNKIKHRLYRQLVRTYLWWREAKDLDGFLEAQYAQIIHKTIPVVKDDTDFGQLVLLTLGAGLPDYTISRYSQLINKLHETYESQPQNYQNNAENQLVHCIISHKGIINWINGGKNPSKKVAKSKASHKMAEKARDFYANVTQLPPITLPYNVTTNDDGYCALLVRRTDQGYELVTSSHEKAIIETLQVSSYKKDFDSLPTSVSPIFELQQTQRLPAPLQRTKEKLQAKTNPRRKALLDLKGRRTLYKHDTHELILSPTNGLPGVVSTITPSTPLFEHAQSDAFLPAAYGQMITKHCLQTYTFNEFTVSNSRQIPQCSPYEEAPTYSVDMQNGQQILHVPFLSFDDSFSNIPSQVVVNPQYAFQPSWQLTVKDCWLSSLNQTLISPWLNSHGKQITLAHNQSIQIHFDQQQLTFAFYHQNGHYHFTDTVKFAQNAQGLSLTAHYATQDIMRVLNSICDLNAIVPIEIAVNRDILRFTYETHAGKHRIFIPALDAHGKRSTAAFTNYQPQMMSRHDASYMDHDVYEDWEHVDACNTLSSGDSAC